MAVPGFSAEAAVYASVIPYVSGFNGTFASENSVAAAAKAIYVDGIFYCYGEVTGSGVVCEGSGGGGGGPVDPGCRPQCGPCRRVGGRRVKTCVNRDCDTFERAC